MNSKCGPAAHLATRAVLLLSAAMLCPAAASAQWASDVSRTVPAQTEAGPGPLTAAPTADLFTAAALGGALGVVPGSMVGGSVICATAKALDSGVTRCGIGDAVLGAALGSGVGMAIGAHLANDRRGSWVIGALATSALGIASIWAAASNDLPGATFAVIPVSMLVTAVAIEQETSPETPE